MMHDTPDTMVECPRCHGAMHLDTPPVYFEGRCHVCDGVGVVTPAARAEYLARLDAPTATEVPDPGSEP